MKKQLISIILFLMLSVSASAQLHDAEGCMDSPYLKRIANSFITECEKDSDEMEFVIFADSVVRMEGAKTFIAYGYDATKAKVAPSFARIVSHFEMLLVRRGGKKMYYSGDAGSATLYLKAGDKQIWIVIDDGSGDGEGYYSLSILEAYGEQNNAGGGQ